MRRDAAPVARAFATLVGRLERAIKRVRRGGDDEAIHDVRVATRRLGALLQVWRGALDDTRRRRARRALRALRRDLAKARDLQVLAAVLGASGYSGPDVAAFAVWRRELDAQIARRTMVAARRCGPRRLAPLRRALGGVAAALEGAPNLATRRLARQMLERRRLRARLALAALDAVTRVADPDAAALLHRARIKVKGWRYGEEVAGVAAARATAMSRELQERLGAIHDRYVLRARAAARGGLDSLIRATDVEIQRGWDDLRAGVPLAERVAAGRVVGARSAMMRAIPRRPIASPAASRRRRVALRARSSPPSRTTRTRTSSSSSSRSTLRRADQSSRPAPRRASTRSATRPARRVTRTERTSW